MSTQIVGIALRLRVALRMPLTISSDDRSLEWDFCLIFAPLRATMGQKSSHPQAAKSVSRVLMSDTCHAATSWQTIGRQPLQAPCCILAKLLILLVEPRGIEPLTSAVRLQRSPI